MKTGTRLLLIVILFLHFNLQANQQDSLKKAWQNAHTIEQKISLSSALTEELMGEDNAEALHFAKENYELNLSISDSIALAETLDNLGEIMRRLGVFDSAEYYFNQAIAIKELAKIEDIHTTYNLLGKTFANEGNYEQSVSSFMSALYLMEQSENKEGQAFYLNNIGIVFDIQGIYDKALEYYLKSLDIKEKTGMKDALAASYNNIGIVYFNLDKFQESLDYHTKALNENKRMNKTRSIARSYNNIGFAHISLKNFNQALANLKIALKMRQDMQDNRAIAQTTINIATSFNELQILDSAFYYANIGKQIAYEIEAKEILDDAYELLAEIYERKGNFDEALNYFKLHTAYRDTLRNKDAFSAIAEMEAKYNLVKKEQEIQKKNFELDKKQLILSKKEEAIKLYSILILLVSLGLLLIAFAYFQKRRINILLKGQNALIEKQNRALNQDKTNLSEALKDKSEILEKVYSDKKTTELPPELQQLSQREMEVLSYLALGWTDHQLAEKLFVSKSTIKTHLRRIYSKLLVNGRAGAVAIAHRHNIIGGADEFKQDEA